MGVRFPPSVPFQGVVAQLVRASASINSSMPKGKTSNSICPKCGKSVSLFAYARHVKTHDIPKVIKPKTKRVAWNKGKTATIDHRVASIAQSVSRKLKSKYDSGELVMSISPETRHKISEKMRRAHAEGRAYSFAHNRGRAEPSYPEKFFAGIIEREFVDKAVEKEFRFFSYSLDFAWPHLKKVIEIDGDQHERFEHRKRSDERKDKKLVENGWQVLRIKWSDMHNDTQRWIQIAKNFITPPSYNGLVQPPV